MRSFYVFDLATFRGLPGCIRGMVDPRSGGGRFRAVATANLLHVPSAVGVPCYRTSRGRIGSRSKSRIATRFSCAGHRPSQPKWKRILQVDPHAKIIFLTTNSDRDVTRAALSAGEQGYVLKTNAARELLTAVQKVLGGENFVSSGIQTDNSGETE